MKRVRIKDGDFVMYKQEPKGKKIPFDVTFKHDVLPEPLIINVEAYNKDFAVLKAVSYLYDSPNYNINCWEATAVEPEDINAIYRVFICSGDRESGAYTAYGRNFFDAALNLATHWNKCSPLKNYGVEWKSAGRQQGYPKHHLFLTDEFGHKLLFINTGGRTCYQPNF